MSVDVTYNGVLLSVAVPTALVANVDRQMLGSVADQWEKVPGRDGAWLYNDNPGPRTIVADIVVNAGTVASRRTAVRALADWLATGDSVSLIFSDESDRYWTAKVSDPPRIEEVVAYGRTSIEWTTADAYAAATSLSTETWTATDGVAHVWSIPDEVGAYPEIAVSPNADVTGFNLTVNGAQLVYGSAVLAGATITISSVSSTVIAGQSTDTELTGVFDEADVSLVDVSGDFGTLAPGSNSITVDTPSGQSAEVTVTWRRRFI